MYTEEWTVEWNSLQLYSPCCDFMTSGPQKLIITLMPNVNWETWCKWQTYAIGNQPCVWSQFPYRSS